MRSQIPRLLSAAVALLFFAESMAPGLAASRPVPVRTVDTIADLIALNPKSVTDDDRGFVQVARYEEGQNWGGVRTAVWDEGSTAATNRGCVFATPNGTGRWRFPDCDDGDVEVPHFGAWRNGIVDDTDAFQAACEYAGANHTVFAPAGVYRLSRMLEANYDYQRIMGNGYNTELRIFHNGHAFGHLGVLEGKPRRYGIRLENLRFTVGGGYNPSNALHLVDVSYGKFIGVFVTGGVAPGYQHAVYTYGNYSIPLQIWGGNWGNGFRDCEFYNRPGPDWVFFGAGGPGATGGPNDLSLDTCYFGGGLGGARTNGATGAIWIENANMIRIDKCDLEQFSTNGVWAGTNVTELIIDKVRFENQGGATAAARRLISHGEDSKGIAVLNNMMRDQGGMGSLIANLRHLGTIMDSTVAVNQWYTRHLLVGLEPDRVVDDYGPQAFSKLSVMSWHADYTNVIQLANIDGVINPRFSLVQVGADHNEFASGSSLASIPIHFTDGAGSLNAIIAATGSSIKGALVAGAALGVYGSVVAGPNPVNAWIEGYTPVNYGTYLRTTNSADRIGFWCGIIDGVNNTRTELYTDGPANRGVIRTTYGNGSAPLDLEIGTNIVASVVPSRLRVLKELSVAGTLGLNDSNTVRITTFAAGGTNFIAAVWPNGVTNVISSQP